MTLDEIMKTIEEPIKSLRTMMSETVNTIEDQTTRKWMNYFIEEKGHMIRPTMTFFSYFCFKDNPTTQELLTLKKLAHCFEFLHTASLIHDDVLDDEEIRHSKRTINQQIGNKGAILVGNVFYLEAFRIASELPNLIYFNSMVNTSENMCFGEVLQLESGNKLMNADQYMNIIQKKTAMLISMCCCEGARLAGASQDMIDVMSRIGLLFGIIYQLNDDNMDKDVMLDSSVIVSDLIKESAIELNRSLGMLQQGLVYSDALISFANMLMK